MYVDALDAGLRLPLHPVLNYFGLAPGQLTPNGWRALVGFVVLSHFAGVAPSLAVFGCFYSLCRPSQPAVRKDVMRHMPYLISACRYFYSIQFILLMFGYIVVICRGYRRSSSLLCLAVENKSLHEVDPKHQKLVMLLFHAWKRWLWNTSCTMRNMPKTSLQ